ncbi:alanine dehydrogenase [bacterium]|nr:alanine dehydrogenase [bacterium]
MIFGIPKEVPEYKEIPECRVGLSPRGVRELVDLGAVVYVENEAGDAAGFDNRNYESSGAQIVYSKAEVYKRSEIIISVRALDKNEVKYLKEGQVVMGFFHLVTASKETIDTFVQKKCTVLGYEIIQTDSGELPIVIPMSELAGVQSLQLAARLLEATNGGRGIVLGGIPGLSPAEVVIIGAGSLGRTAARVFKGIGANVYVLDNNRKKLEWVYEHVGYNLTTLFANKRNLEKLVRFADVLIGAVLIPGERAPVLISREMVKTMKKGSVILDFSIDQGGCVETSKISHCGDTIFSEEGVIHFCMPTATSLVPRSATHALTNGIIPYLKEIVKSGFEGAKVRYPEIQRGIYIDNGELKKEYLK